MDAATGIELGELAGGCSEPNANDESNAPGGLFRNILPSMCGPSFKNPCGFPNWHNRRMSASLARLRLGSRRTQAWGGAPVHAGNKGRACERTGPAAPEESSGGGAARKAASRTPCR